MTPKVLFLCTGNSCRSQMAEGWTKKLLQGQVEAYSAGTNPHGLNPLAIKAMAEVGIDISGHGSKSLESLSSVHFDLLVAVCDSAAASCPTTPNATRAISIPFDDPPTLAKQLSGEEQKMSPYRRVRDEIKSFVLTLPSLLGERA